jgi:agmatinase
MKNIPIVQAPYMGIPSFLRSEIARDRTKINSNVCFIGIPYDTGTSNRPGARYGPKAFREASMIYAYAVLGKPLDDIFDAEECKSLLGQISIIDSNDIFVIPENRDLSERIITEEIRKVLSNSSFPLVVGGDHSISYPVIRAYEKPLTILQFDAHSDYMSEEYLQTCPHGTTMRRASKLENVKKIIHCGIRGLLNSKQGLEDTISDGNVVITTSQLKEKGFDALYHVLDQNETYYITFDTDILDPVIAPGTGTPEPGGIDFVLAQQLIKQIVRNYQVIGCDFVELNPLYDQTSNTAQHLVRLSIDLIGNIPKSKKLNQEKDKSGLNIELQSHSEHLSSQLQMSIIYHSVSGNTKQMAYLIQEGANHVPGISVKTMDIDNVDLDYINSSRALIIGSPTYYGGMSWQMKKFLDTFETHKISLEGKIGAVFSTANWMGGGSEITLMSIQEALLCYGMLLYSGGVQKGLPYNHFGAVSKKRPKDYDEEKSLKFGRDIAIKTLELFS